MNLVVDIDVQSCEAKLAVGLGQVGDDIIGVDVLQIDNGGIDGSLVFVHHRPANSPRLRFTALGFALCEQHDCRQRHDRNECNFSGPVYVFPPAICSIWNVRSSWSPSRASTLRVCDLKPRASTVNSYSAPCLTLIPSSPRRSDMASQRNFCSSARRTRTLAPGKAKPCWLN